MRLPLDIAFEKFNLIDAVSAQLNYYYFFFNLGHSLNYVLTRMKSKVMEIGINFQNFISLHSYRAIMVWSESVWLQIQFKRLIA